MENETAVPIWMTIIAVIFIPVLGWFVIHYFATSREKGSRRAAASTEFRNTLIRSTKGIPESGAHWSNDSLIKLKKAESEIDTACEIYAHFLGFFERKRFLRSANKLNSLISRELPEPKTQENLVASGGLFIPEEVKIKFHKLKKKLLSFAKST